MVTKPMFWDMGNLVLVSNTMFFGMGNQFRTSPEASDWPEHQDQALLAVGVQQSLHGVTHLLSNPWFWVIQNHLGPV